MRRKKRIKVLYFTETALMTSTERDELRTIKARLREEYDEETVELDINILNSAVPQYTEKCDFVCGNVPYQFKKYKHLDAHSDLSVKTVRKSAVSSKKKDLTTNVHQ